MPWLDDRRRHVSALRRRAGTPQRCHVLTIEAGEIIGIQDDTDQARRPSSAGPTQRAHNTQRLVVVVGAVGLLSRQPPGRSPTRSWCRPRPRRPQQANGQGQSTRCRASGSRTACAARRAGGSAAVTGTSWVAEEATARRTILPERDLGVDGRGGAMVDMVDAGKEPVQVPAEVCGRPVGASEMPAAPDHNRGQLGGHPGPSPIDASVTGSRPVSIAEGKPAAGIRSKTAVRRRRTGAGAIARDNGLAFAQVSHGVVGLTGLEPAASSLSEIDSRALC